MKELFLEIIHVIKKHGSYSFPFVNYVLENGNIFLLQERDFLLSLKYSYESKNRKALKVINARLRTKPNSSMLYLLLFRKLKLLRMLGKEGKADDIYQHIRDNIVNVSPAIREFIISELIGHCALSKSLENCLGKFHVDGNCLSDSAKAFLEINIGRNLIRNGDVNGLEHFKKALDIAKSIPHPSGIITSLNALAWYGKEYDLDEANLYAKESLHWMGWYFENMRLYVFDTALEVLNESQDNSIYEIAKDFIFLYEISPDEERKKYKKRFTQAKRMLSTTFYKSDGKTRRLLRRMNKQKSLGKVDISRKEIFNLLHSKVKSIRGETIRKIISTNSEFFKEIELSKLPKGFACEIAKEKVGLQDGIESIINDQKSLDPFVQARKDLTMKYLERMPKRIRERFIQRYLTLDDEEKEIIDRFARDYIRYDIHWGMRAKMPEEMEKYAKAFHLKKIPTALAYFGLDDEKERDKLVEVLENFR